MSLTVEIARLTVVLDVLERFDRSHLTSEEGELFDRAAIMLAEVEWSMAGRSKKHESSDPAG